MRRHLTALCLVSLILAFTGQAPVRADQNDPRLAQMFADLQSTDDANEGDRLGREIAQIWLMSGSAEIDALMHRGHEFIEHDLAAAMDTFRRVTTLAPEFAEGWSKRAQVRYLLGDFEQAINHIGQTLKLEPRHFLALAGLGLIYLEMGEQRQALTAFQRALEINPYLFGVRRTVDKLKKKLDNDKA